MDSMIELAKAETLEAMYLSLERMNRAIAEENQEVYQAEVGLQCNLSRNFRELSTTY